MMRTLGWITATITAGILIYTLRQPTLRAIFYNPRDIVETPDGWEPKMRTWHKGEPQ